MGFVGGRLASAGGGRGPGEPHRGAAGVPFEFSPMAAAGAARGSKRGDLLMMDVELGADRSSGRTAKFLASASIAALALSAAEPALAQPVATATTDAQP